MENLQDKIERLKKAVSDRHSMPAPMMEAPMMDMAPEMTPERCPDGSVPGPMGCPPEPEEEQPGCCVYQIGNQQIPVGMLTKSECDAQGGIHLGEGVECPGAAIKTLITFLQKSV
tara:strand:+ start:2209 stop:2553 length:345 start_codon:yes stop_codon:yes gene_type:complete